MMDKRFMELGLILTMDGLKVERVVAGNVELESM